MVRFVDSGGEETDTDPGDGLAPVIPLFGGRAPQPEPLAHARRVRERPLADEAVSADDDRFGAAGEPQQTAEEVRAAAEEVLLRKLRARQLSVREARTVLVEQGLAAEDRDELIETFLERGYLDDARLAEQLIHAGVDRKGQGRQMIAQAMAKRGLARDVADEAIAELPDDDADRALEFARGKARSMSSLDPQVALRRLAGQLARRGYPGSVALDAARKALAEQGSGSTVRFR